MGLGFDSARPSRGRHAAALIADYNDWHANRSSRGYETFMTHIIAQPCIDVKDGACIAVCPVDCIHPTKEERAFGDEKMLYIDPAICIDCGLCIDECPVKAIFPEQDLPEEWSHFVQLNADYYSRPILKLRRDD